MKLWVRSQDKCTLQESRHFSVQEVAEPNKKHTKWAVVTDFEIIGEYETKERCLEIIDEIQSLFCDFLICKDVTPCDHPQFQKLGLTSVHYFGKDFDPKIEYHERSSIVYKMPKE